jgi:asparagine N-glycosylation enzyme membrane subunit Stt3
MSDGPDFPSGEPLLVEPMMAAPVDLDLAAVEPAVASVVVESVASVAPLMSSSVRRSYARSFAPDAIVAALVGLFVLLVGLLAVTRGGFDGPMDTPVVSVLGFTHTTALGLIEIVIGGSLLLSGATRSRSAAQFFGSVLGIAAFVGAVQTESFRNNLALESGLAWLMVIGGLMVVLSALLLPRYVQRSTLIYPV